MAWVGGGFRQLAASSAGALACGLAAVGPCAKAEERSWRNPTYKPPPRFHSSFAALPVVPPGENAAGGLAWAVKRLDVARVREILEGWPHGAALLDEEDNTLFHVAASQPDLCRQQPEAARQLFELLLQHGWQVVDQKNRHGERAEVVAKRLAPEGVTKQLLGARSHDYGEALRSDRPLRLVGEQSPVPWLWHYLWQDEQRRSFAGVVKRAVDPETCSRWFEKTVKSLPWKKESDGRHVTWLVSKDCWDCPYRYSGNLHAAHIYPPFMEELMDVVCGQLCGLPREKYPNCCNVNLYPGGEPPIGEVGWHADDEVYFQSLSDDTLIISFSLGSDRDFKWRLQGTDTPLGTVSLGDGDLMTMEGLFQKHYKHSVPKSSVACGPRINFTFRWIVVKAHAEDAGTAAVTGTNSAA